jgi:lipopolysaccharide transport system ATP-binding protein
MGNAVIQVVGLSKCYRIGERRTYKVLRDKLAGLIFAPFRGIAPGNAGRPSTNATRTSHGLVWALKDLSFEVERGHITGIIGSNGAGKSTLLRILSRIIEPTEGYAKIHGRVGSLIEVGTGFHPELTGRENVYLNGAIIGMSKAEITRKFDEIVSFAEVEDFIDTPVKFYSSGMYVRLAFAVAAHLEPEILLVDEILAVGDVAFQKKCLNKMGTVAKEGRTIVLVSHSMATVQSLCDVGIVINHGKAAVIGPVNQAIQHYLAQLEHADAEAMRGRSELKMLVPRLSPGPRAQKFTADGPLLAQVQFHTKDRLVDCHLSLVIEDVVGHLVVHCRSDVLGIRPSFDPGTHHIFIEMPRLSLRGGAYTIGFRLLANGGGDAVAVDSERVKLEVDGPRVGGLLDVPCRWSWERVEASSPELVRGL